MVWYYHEKKIVLTFNDLIMIMIVMIRVCYMI